MRFNMALGTRNQTSISCSPRLSHWLTSAGNISIVQWTFPSDRIRGMVLLKTCGSVLVGRSVFIGQKAVFSSIFTSVCIRSTSYSAAKKWSILLGVRDPTAFGSGSRMYPIVWICSAVSPTAGFEPGPLICQRHRAQPFPRVSCCCHRAG